MRQEDTLPARAARRSPDETYALRLAAGFAALVVVTFTLIVLGALVRAHDAGLACPDWPLCFGEFVPQLDLRVGFEWTHRVLAGSLSLCFLALAALALARPATRRSSLPLLAAGAVLLALQILLGALTVWHLLASWTVTAHLLTGNAFAAVLLWTALALRDGGRRDTVDEPHSAGVKSWVAAGALLLLLQMVLGGLVSSRHAGLACPEWPSCQAGEWFPRFDELVGLHLLHRWNAVLLLAVLLRTLLAARGTASLGRVTRLALALGVCQLVVGVANVWLRLPVEITGLHSALAAALVLTWSLAVRETTVRG